MTTTTDTPTTEDVIFGMLTENTGRHFLDSGGAYGRAWEKNQGKTLADFQAAPEAFWDGYGVTLSVFHFLKDVLTYDADLDAEFQQFADSPMFADDGWLEIMEAFAEYKEARRPTTVNTYNGEDLLSQTIQYTAFIPSGDMSCWWDDDDAVILLQIHGGCDVRGGYTRPRAFRHGSMDRTILDNARCAVSCEGVEPPMDTDLFGETVYRDHHSWSCYDGYSFEPNNDETPFPSDMPVDEDGKPVCPMCSAPLGIYGQ